MPTFDVKAYIRYLCFPKKVLYQCSYFNSMGCLYILKNAPVLNCFTHKHEFARDHANQWHSRWGLIHPKGGIPPMLKHETSYPLYLTPLST